MAKPLQLVFVIQSIISEFALETSHRNKKVHRITEIDSFYDRRDLNIHNVRDDILASE